MGQWKFSTVANPEWNKRALSWPVTDDGTWNNVSKNQRTLIKPIVFKITVQLSSLFTYAKQEIATPQIYSKEVWSISWKNLEFPEPFLRKSVLLGKVPGYFLKKMFT